MTDGIPPFIAAIIEQSIDHEKVRMQAADGEAVLNEFLDSLTPKQLVTLKTVLRTDKSVRTYVTGIVDALLRHVHKVDTGTGLSPEEALLGDD